MKNLKTSLLVTLALVINISAFGQTGGDRLLGTYQAVGEVSELVSHVKFTKMPDNTYEAKIIWVNHLTDEKGEPLCDILNPDPELRKVKADNIRIVWGLTYDQKADIWKGGTVYNPVAGKSYDVQITFEDPQKLKVRGYMGRPMLGKNFYWDKLQ